MFHDLRYSYYRTSFLSESIKVKGISRSCHSDTERLSRSDEVLKLKNFKKDATLKLFKSTNQERYEHVGQEVTSSQYGQDLGHTGEIHSLNDVVVDQMHQPWRTFAALINRSLSGKTIGLDKLRLSRAQIL
ncbi:hypothetical protein Tco_0148926 [Tanacetum coccineum]